MRYDDLAERYAAIESTTKRLEMTDQLVGLLRAAEPDEVEAIVYLSQGKLRPDFEGTELGLAEKLAVKALVFTTGVAEDDLTARLRELGDLGSVAEEALDRERDGASAGARQTTLFGAAGSGDGGGDGDAPSVLEVHGALVEVARASGSGSQERKVQLLHRLLTRLTPLGARYVVRTVTGKLRLGVADMTLVDALAYLAAFPGGDVESLSVTDMDEDARASVEDAKARIERAYNVSSDLGGVARLVAERGLAGLDEVRIQVGVPLRPMLAERLQDPREILEKQGGRCAVEYKYDGLRLQGHIPEEGEVRFFSRRLEDLTGQFPDVAEALRASFRGREAIVEGEVVAVDDQGEMLPFQRLSQRRGRKHDIERMVGEVPVAIVLFDVMLLDGEDLTGEPLPERRRRLTEAFEAGDDVRFSDYTVVEDPQALLDVFDRSVTDGAEGIMAKSLGDDATYRAGARGWQWIKFKKDYDRELHDSLDLVVVGAFMGRGRRRGWYGSLLMATYEPHEDRFTTVCKVATGFSDEDLKALEPAFEDHVLDHVHPRVTSELEPDVWIAPVRVAEVVAAEITVSPVHTAARDAVREGSGLALRFPRFIRWRDDKAPEDATTSDEVVTMYRAQTKEARALAGDADEGGD